MKKAENLSEEILELAVAFLFVNARYSAIIADIFRSSKAVIDPLSTSFLRRLKKNYLNAGNQISERLPALLLILLTADF